MDLPDTIPFFIKAGPLSKDAVNGYDRVELVPNRKEPGKYGCIVSLHEGDQAKAKAFVAYLQDKGIEPKLFRVSQDDNDLKYISTITIERDDVPNLIGISKGNCAALERIAKFPSGGEKSL